MSESEDRKSEVDGSNYERLEEHKDTDSSHSGDVNDAISLDPSKFTIPGAGKEQGQSDSEKVVFKLPKFIGPRQGWKSRAVSHASPSIKNDLSDTRTEIKNSGSESQSNESVVQEPRHTEESLISREEKLQERNISVPYKEPPWSAQPDQHYTLEVLKSGLIIDEIDLGKKPYFVFGRLASCDVVLEHPSISRFHAVLQYRTTDNNEDQQRPKGFYLYDLGSTHGTFLNKNQLGVRTYCRMRVGHMMKLGGSSRMFILQGPSDDEEEESELTVTELKQLRAQQEEKLRILNAAEKEERKVLEEQEKNSEDKGIDWGMGEDAIEDDENVENPFALEAPEMNEDLYINDPKKTLRGWFEREGYELEYNVEEKGPARFLCRVQLPLDEFSGKPIVAEAFVHGKKKEAVVACALEACRILDRYGVLRRANQESRKKQEKNWEQNDYYDSDDDTFLDRTGSIEKKRQRRLQRLGKTSESVETHETLLTKYADLKKEIVEVTEAIESKKSTTDSADTMDSLDLYMMSIKGSNEKSNSLSRSRLRMKLALLNREELRLQKLLNITKPAELPAVLRTNAAFGKEDMDSSPVKKFGLINIKINKTASIAVPPNVETSSAADLGQTGICENKVEETTKVLTENTPEELKETERHILKDEHQEKGLTEDCQPALPQKRKTARNNPSKKLGDKRKFKYDESDPKYAVWIPPQDQCGDGKTRLNDKYGY